MYRYNEQLLVVSRNVNVFKGLYRLSPTKLLLLETHAYRKQKR